MYKAKPCLVCGAAHRNKTYCSHKCAIAAITKTIRTEKPCLYCTKITMNAQFCSTSCACTYKNLVKPNIKRRHFYCASCDTPCAYKRKYCKECLYKIHRRDYSTITLGDLKKKKKTFHQNVRDIARRWYENTDRPKQCVICKFPFYEICHIKPIKDFSDSSTITEINAEDNLIALCPNHHWLLDHGDLVLSKDYEGRIE